MTTVKTITFLLSKNGGKISGEEIQKLAEKALNKNTVQTTWTWMNVWKSWAESKGLQENNGKYEAGPDQCLSRFFAENFLASIIVKWAVRGFWQ